MKAYSYAVEDRSLLTPFLYRFCVDPLLRVVPYRVPANLITLCANACMLLAFTHAYCGSVGGTYAYWFLVPVLCIVYLVGDCLDGRQARRTGTGSPLGEYFDHCLDTSVVGLLAGIFVLAFRIREPFLLTCIFFVPAFVQISTLWEKLHRGVMVFARIGSNEMVVLTTLGAYAGSFETLCALFLTPLFFSCTPAQVCVSVLSTGVCIFSCAVFWRMRVFSCALFLHLSLFFFLCVFSSTYFPTQIGYITALCTLYHMRYAERLLRVIVQGEGTARVEVLVPLLCGVLFLFPQTSFWVQRAQCSILALEVGVHFVRFVYAHRCYWHWLNPLPTQE